MSPCDNWPVSASLALLWVLGLSACSPVGITPEQAPASEATASDTRPNDETDQSGDAPLDTATDAPDEDKTPVLSETPPPDEESSNTDEFLPENHPESVCTYEWVTGMAEVVSWEADKARLIFYPGEVKLSVDRQSIAPYLAPGQNEVKSRLQMPLNNECGNPAISFSPEAQP